MTSKPGNFFTQIIKQKNGCDGGEANVTEQQALGVWCRHRQMHGRVAHFNWSLAWGEIFLFPVSMTHIDKPHSVRSVPTLFTSLKMSTFDCP